MNDYDYIKSFQKINITKICKKKKIDRGNLMKGRTKKENYKIVREEIESEIAKLYLKDENI